MQHLIDNITQTVEAETTKSECPLCFDEYDQKYHQPKILHSTHIVCKQCFEQMIKSQVVDKTLLICPLCTCELKQSDVQTKYRTCVVRALLHNTCCFLFLFQMRTGNIGT